MAHEIEVDAEGKAAMFYVGETPWHGLGQALAAPPTAEEAIKLAGLDWTVKTEQAYIVNPAGEKVEIPARAVVRSSDQKVLGVVGESYQPVQNAQAFSFFDPFIKSGAAEYHTAGSLRGGSRIWVLAKLTAATAEVVPGDPVENYIMLPNSHDGSLALSPGFTSIRIVCANTLSSALQSEASKMIRVKHTTNVVQNLEAVRDAMNLATREFEATVEQYRALARLDINQEDLAKYIRIVFATPGPKGSDGGTTPPIDSGDGTPPTPAGEDTSCKRLLPKIVELFETGKGSHIKGVKGTLWQAYNAVTEYLTWHRGTDADRRCDNLWFGQGANLNKKALVTALKMAYRN